MLDKSQNIVADKLLFTATKEFFKDMTRDIKDWDDTCIEFVYDGLCYTKEQILHIIVHLNEKTPNIPKLTKYDKL